MTGFELPLATCRLFSEPLLNFALQDSQVDLFPGDYFCLFLHLELLALTMSNLDQRHLIKNDATKQ